MKLKEIIMIEYEYSYEVKNLAPYIDYCKANGFKLVEQYKQQRTIYRNKNKTMARITINENDGIISKQLDFKEDNLTDEILSQKRESIPLSYTDDKAVDSILDFLGYSKDNTLIRNRYVYIKENVKFELDEYTQPRITSVLGLEGNKIEVDKIFEKIRKFDNK